MVYANGKIVFARRIKNEHSALVRTGRTSAHSPTPGGHGNLAVNWIGNV